MTTTPEAKGLVPAATAGRELPWISWGLLVVAGCVVLFPLSYAWSYLENYAYGWWVPLLAVFVFSERWVTRPAPESTGRAPGMMGIVLAWFAAFFFFRMALESSLSSRPLLGCIALLYVGALLYWMWIYGGKAWARHFAFPICFLLISVPWPAQIEDPIVQGLQQFNAQLVAHVLIICGIYAQAMGNVIALANCTLGVEAACSGIRSLQAALMVGFLVGEFYRFTWLRRGKILLLAVGLAFFGNFSRALFLALTASFYGADAMSHWHDTAGFSILIFTSAATCVVAALLNKYFPQEAPVAATNTASPWSPMQGVRAQRFACGILAAAVIGVVLTEGWYDWSERGGVLYPTWTASLPSTGKFENVAIPDESRGILKYDDGKAVQWQDEWQWTGYWFRYHPKATGETVFQAHNPDRCLPATGFEKVKDFEPFVAEVNGIRLQVFPKQFSNKGDTVYVFWIVYANRASFPMEKALTSIEAGPWTKARLYFSNIWHGRRASTSEMESLETIMAGPTDYAAAKTGYLTALQKIIVPDAGQVAPAK